MPIRNELPDLVGSSSFSSYQCTNHSVAANEMLLQLQGRIGGPGFTLLYICIGDFPRPPAPGGPLVCRSTPRKSSAILNGDSDGTFSGDRGANLTVLANKKLLQQQGRSGGPRRYRTAHEHRWPPAPTRSR